MIVFFGRNCDSLPQMWPFLVAVVDLPKDESDEFYTFEYFDPAGSEGDRKSIGQLREWAQKDLSKSSFT